MNRYLTLTALLTAPATIDVDALDWGLAAALAALRTASNQQPGQYRTIGQDRGATQNFINDLQGCIGELLLLRELEHAEPAAAIGHCLYDPGGGGASSVSSSVDAAVRFDAQRVAAQEFRTGSAVDRHEQRPAIELLLEAKCHLDIPADLAERWDVAIKRDFAVNYKAVRDSHRLGAVGLIPYITVPGGAHAIRGRMIALADALRWPLTEYHPTRDLALALPLEQLAPIAFDQPLKHLLPPLGPVFAAATQKQLTNAAAVAAANRTDARLAELSALPAGAAIARLRALAREWQAAGS